MTGRVTCIVGAGPGLGAAIAQRFGRAGWSVALVARREEALEALGAELEAAGVTAGWAAADVTDGPALRAAVERFAAHTDGIDHLHFNPSTLRMADPLVLTADELLADLRLGIAGILDAVQGARPHLRPGARITATGSAAARRPWAAAASLGVQKAGLANLVTSIDATLAPEGIRAATLTVDGTLAADGPNSHTSVADSLLRLVERPDDDWTTEVVHGQR